MTDPAQQLADRIRTLVAEVLGPTLDRQRAAHLAIALGEAVVLLHVERREQEASR